MAEEPIRQSSKAPLTVEAMVIGVQDSRVRLHLIQKDGHAVLARVAVPGYQAQTGDRVLAHLTGEQCYLIGVLHSAAYELAYQNRRELPKPQGPVQQVELEDGSLAEISSSSMELRSPEGRLLVRYNASLQRLELTSEGDLSLTAPNGSITLDAEQELNLKAPKGQLELGSMQLRSDHANFEFGKLELRSERLIGKLAESFVDITRIAESRVHRMRTLVKTSLELAAERTSLRSKQDTRIDGKRILLG